MGAMEVNGIRNTHYATRNKSFSREHTVTKQLYDPHMFDFMWESVIPR